MSQMADAAADAVCVLCVQVLWGVARVLGLQHTQVHVTCKRVGGGFGGKVRAWLLLLWLFCSWQLL
jgi:CO/xanthine dehydrogenase Mo-binding subunit